MHEIERLYSLPFLIGVVETNVFHAAVNVSRFVVGISTFVVWLRFHFEETCVVEVVDWLFLDSTIVVKAFRVLRLVDGKVVAIDVEADV